MRPTSPLLGRLRKMTLSTKRVSKGWHYADYNKVGMLGSLDKKGFFVPDYSKIRTFVIPRQAQWKGYEYKMNFTGEEVCSATG